MLGQCGGGEFLRHPGEGVDRGERLAYASGSSPGHLRLHRELVQPATAALKPRLPHPRGVRGTGCSSSGSLNCVSALAGELQILLEDLDSRLMKTQGRMDVCYNAQIAVASKHHLIVANDLLLPDNMLMAHSRLPFTGERKVVVGMAEASGSAPARADRRSTRAPRKRARRAAPLKRSRQHGPGPGRDAVLASLADGGRSTGDGCADAVGTDRLPRRVREDCSGWGRARCMPARAARHPVEDAARSFRRVAGARSGTRTPTPGRRAEPLRAPLLASGTSR
jgi:hypothetical protein